MITVYLRDYATGAFCGTQTLSVADCDPRAPDTLLIPGDATLVPPPRCSKGLWPFWRDGQWVVFEQVDTFFDDFDN